MIFIHVCMYYLIFKIIVCIWMFCLTCLSVQNFHTVSVEARRRRQILWNWSHNQFWATMWVLGIQTGSSGITVTALICWALSPLVVCFNLIYDRKGVLKFSISVVFFSFSWRQNMWWFLDICMHKNQLEFLFKTQISKLNSIPVMTPIVWMFFQ